MFRDKKHSHCPLGLLKWLFRSLILQPSLLLIHHALWSHHDLMKCESDHISALGKRKHVESSGTRSRMWSCLEKSDPCMSTSHGLLENSDFGKGPHIPQSLQGRLSWWAEKWKGPGKQFLKMAFQTMPWKIKQYFVFNHKCSLVLFIGYSSFVILPPSCRLKVFPPQKILWCWSTISVYQNVTVLGDKNSKERIKWGHENGP